MKRLCLLLLILTLTLSGCGKLGDGEVGHNTMKSCTFTAPSGDIIEISVPTNKGYDITSGSPFEITKDGVKVFDGALDSVSRFTGIYKNVRASTEQQLIDLARYGDLYYYGYIYTGGCNFVGYLHNSSILLQSSSAEDVVKESFYDLEIKLITGVGAVERVPELDMGTGAALICSPFGDDNRINYGFSD